ncbi:hypothetical protein [Pseudovibrio sp. SCP19]|uniref:hypothetical protein n=1 Tax=Pseudovibrio sp. SCP19 TaxID=3141374 RepID=UPI0033361DA5
MIKKLLFVLLAAIPLSTLLLLSSPVQFDLVSVFLSSNSSGARGANTQLIERALRSSYEPTRFDNVKVEVKSCTINIQKVLKKCDTTRQFSLEENRIDLRDFLGVESVQINRPKLYDYTRISFNSAPETTSLFAHITEKQIFLFDKLKEEVSRKEFDDKQIYELKKSNEKILSEFYPPLRSYRMISTCEGAEWLLSPDRSFLVRNDLANAMYISLTDYISSCTSTKMK